MANSEKSDKLLEAILFLEAEGFFGLNEFIDENGRLPTVDELKQWDDEARPIWEAVRRDRDAGLSNDQALLPRLPMLEQVRLRRQTKNGIELVFFP